MPGACGVATNHRRAPLIISAQCVPSRRLKGGQAVLLKAPKGGTLALCPGPIPAEIPAKCTYIADRA